jgi:hypothetical protein
MDICICGGCHVNLVVVILDSIALLVTVHRSRQPSPSLVGAVLIIRSTAQDLLNSPE